MSDVRELLERYQQIGGRDPLLYRAALPWLLDEIIVRSGGRKTRTMGEELNQWFLVEQSRRKLRQDTGNWPTWKAALRRAGVSSSALDRARKCSLVRSLENMRTELKELHSQTGRSPHSAEDLWWGLVEGIHADWELMRDMERKAREMRNRGVVLTPSMLGGAARSQIAGE